MKSLRYIAILLAVAFWATGRACAVHAQALQRDTLTYTVFFRPGIETVYYPYKTNQAALTELRSLLWRDPSARVSVCVYAAPEGDVFDRGALVQARARILRNWLVSSCGLPASNLEVNLEMDWHQSSEPRAVIRIVTPAAEVKQETEEVQAQGFAPELSSLDMPGLVPDPVVTPRTILAVKTNALAIPLANVIVEVPIGAHWSLGLEWFYPWLWRSHTGDGVDYSGKCFQVLSGCLDTRYWFSARRDRLSGHAVGLFGMGGIYDLEWDYHGFQGEFLATGVEYIYVCPVFRDKLRLEFSLGLGYLYSRAREYSVYLEGGQAFTEKDMAKDIHFVGPVKGGISLVVPIRTPKKGGRL